MRGSVAQLVEQRTENPCVGGSNPPRTTSKPRFQAGFFIESDGNYLCQIMNEVKCPSCNTWYNKQLQACSACSHILPVHDTFAPQNDHRTIKPFEMPLPSWNTKAKNPFLRFAINTLVAGQWFVMLIAASLAYMAYWVAI